MSWLKRDQAHHVTLSYLKQITNKGSTEKQR